MKETDGSVKLHRGLQKQTDLVQEHESGANLMVKVQMIHKKKNGLSIALSGKERWHTASLLKQEMDLFSDLQLHTRCSEKRCVILTSSPCLISNTFKILY
jgi:hypothetical protein